MSDAIIVTGAAGFIGSHVCEALLSRGARIVGIDNFDPFYDESVKRRNLQEVEHAAHAGGEFEFVRADIRDGAAIGALFDRVRPDGVVHLAARAGVRPSIADPEGYASVNVVGTSIVLEASRRAQCPRLLIASSSSVYGNASAAPFSEEDPVNEPISPYAATKRACELIAYTHWHLTGTPTASLRFFTVYGPRQRPDLAIGKFLRLIARGEPITVFGDGSTSRDYTYIDDIVAGVLAAYDRIDAHGYRIWNLGADRPVTLDEMVRAVGAAVGREPVLHRQRAQPGDVERTWADLTRSRAELGYAPTVALADGMARQWEWTRRIVGVNSPQ